MASDLLLDLRMSLRAWRRRPALITTTLVTLTAGLGIAIGVFSLAFAVLWRPIDVPDPDNVVVVRTVERDVVGASSPGAALTWQVRARSTEAVALVWRRAATLVDEVGAERVEGAFASPEWMTILHIAPLLGRSFTQADSAGASDVVMISERLWQERYNRQRQAIGALIQLNGRARSVIGVLPNESTSVLGQIDWIAPLQLTPAQASNFGARYLEVVARLSRGVDPGAARSELEALVPGLQVAIETFASDQVAAHRDLLLLLIGGVVLLLAVACANVASLLLADALDRHREFSLRASLGADRSRLVRQLLSEAALVASLAGLGGLLVAQWVVDGLRLVLPPEIPRLQSADVDLAALVFAIAAVALVAFGCGVVPAMRATRLDLVSGLSGLGARVISGDDRLRRGFVVAQIALSVVLAVAGGLVLRSASALESAPRGYDTEGLFTATIGLPAVYDSPASIAALVARVRSNVRDIPAVSDVAVASRVPLGGDTVGSNVALAGQPLSAREGYQSRIRLVGGGYATATGTRLVSGRDIAASDTDRSDRVVVVNQTLARLLEPSGDIVGRALMFEVKPFNEGDRRRTWTVVGVAQDWFDRGPRSAVLPEVFVPMAQAPPDVFMWMNRQLVVAGRSTIPVTEQVTLVRQAIARVDPLIPVSSMSTLGDQLRAQFARERVASRLLTAAAVSGVALAGLGLFTVVNHLVRRQTLEIALRLALGGPPASVVRDFVRDGLRLAIVGLVIGVAASVGVSGLVESLLFGVNRLDAMTYGSVALLVVAGCFVATWWPARRSTRVDLAAVLRGR